MAENNTAYSMIPSRTKLETYFLKKAVDIKRTLGYIQDSFVGL